MSRSENQDWTERIKAIFRVVRRGDESKELGEALANAVLRDEELWKFVDLKLENKFTKSKFGFVAAAFLGLFGSSILSSFWFNTIRESLVAEQTSQITSRIRALEDSTIKTITSRLEETVSDFSKKAKDFEDYTKSRKQFLDTEIFSVGTATGQARQSIEVTTQSLTQLQNRLLEMQKQLSGVESQQEALQNILKEKAPELSRLLAATQNLIEQLESRIDKLEAHAKIQSTQAK